MVAICFQYGSSSNSSSSSKRLCARPSVENDDEDELLPEVEVEDAAGNAADSHPFPAKSGNGLTHLLRSMCCWELTVPTARKGRVRPSGGSLASNRPFRRGVRQTDRDRGPTDLLFGPALRVLPLQHGLHPSDGLPTGRPFSVVVEVVFRHTDGLPRGPPGLPRLFHGSPADTASRCHVYSPASRIRMIPAG